ncbi:hypothetical protein D9M71_47060 [compost metagenome]
MIDVRNYKTREPLMQALTYDGSPNQIGEIAEFLQAEAFIANRLTGQVTMHLPQGVVVEFTTGDVITRTAETIAVMPAQEFAEKYEAV